MSRKIGTFSEIVVSTGRDRLPTSQSLVNIFGNGFCGYFFNRRFCLRFGLRAVLAVAGVALVGIVVLNVYVVEDNTEGFGFNFLGWSFHFNQHRSPEFAMLSNRKLI